MNGVRFRKISDVNRRHPIFEVLVEEQVLFDLSLGEDGELEFAVHQGAVNCIFSVEEIQRVIVEGTQRIREETDAAGGGGEDAGAGGSR